MSSAMMNRMLGLVALGVAMLGSCASGMNANAMRRGEARRIGPWSYRVALPLCFEAARGVVVDQPGGLHECVDDGRADEAHPALLEILRQCVGLCGADRDVLHSFRFSTKRLSA